MITRFNIFESNELPSNKPNKMVNDISFTIYKGKKRNGNFNYKQLKVINFDTDTNIYVDSNHIKNSITTINIDMSNKDNIGCKHIVKKNLEGDIESSIDIKINNKSVFDLDSESFDEKVFKEKIISEYKKYLKSKNWKIK